MRVVGGTRELTIHQYANDFITADPPEPRRSRDEEKPLILSPLKVQLNAQEVAAMRADEAEAAAKWAENGEHSTGQFWRWWMLSDDGYFKRRMAYGVRPAPTRASGPQED